MTKQFKKHQSFFQTPLPRTFLKKFLTKKQAKHVLMDESMSLKVSYEEMLFLQCLIKQSSPVTWLNERPLSKVSIHTIPFTKNETEILIASLVKKQFISIDISIKNFYYIRLSGLYKKLLPLISQEYLDMEEVL